MNQFFFILSIPVNYILDFAQAPFLAYNYKVMTERTRQKAHIEFTLNGEPVEVAFAPHKTLLEVVREDLGLTGTKHGCELGECGTCAVLVNGRSILSCLMLGLEAEGQEVTTIEGMSQGAKLHPLQDTFADLGA